MRRIACASSLLLPLFFSNTVVAEDDPRLKAIDQGVQYLKEVHKEKKENDGGGNHRVGSAALCGLALLESGVPAADPVIANITTYIRENAIRQSKVYDVSLVIMFLDRLGDTADKPAIQFLAIRLMSAQSREGHWSYDCTFEIGEADLKRVQKVLYDDNRLQSPMAKDGPNRKNDTGLALHPEAVRLIRAVESAVRSGAYDAGSTGDHSNTQFATLALWMARKHGVPCNDSLALVEKHFRSTQGRDGGWDYGGGGLESTSTPPMTCSGLVALAVGRGIAFHALRTKGLPSPKGTDAADATTDRAALAALKYIENAVARSEKGMDEPTGGENSGKLRDNLYFLWSLERVAMIYDLQKIGALDWYEWGANHLIKTQSKDGSWGQSGYQGASGEINTAFALLFLNRANLAKDLTATLKGKANVKLPDRVTNPEPVKVDPKQKNDAPPVSPGSSEFDAEANRLCNALVSADASKRAGVLAQLRDNKGSVYTEGLVRAIAKLKGEQQREAREALAVRLKRMNAITLRDMLRDENREIRMAAATACGLKEDKQFVPDLIAVLGDADNLTVQAARTSLRNLSQKDFGPNDSASADDKAKAVAAWRAWWASQPK